MMLAIKQFTAISALTMVETMRRPVCLLLATVTVLYMGMAPVIIAHSFGEAGKLVRDSNLAVFIMGGLILGSFAACYSLSSEIRQGTASSIVAKPVNRSLFLVAKVAGVTAFMLSYALLCLPAILLSGRSAREAYTLDLHGSVPLFLAPGLGYLAGGIVNYVARRPFASNAYGWMVAAMWGAMLYSGFIDPEGAWTSHFGEVFHGGLVAAMVLLTFATIMLLSISALLATRLDLIPTLTCCTLLFLLGLTSDYFFGRLAPENMAADMVYRLIPNWSHFWLADALNNGGRIAWSYVMQAGVYAVTYTSGIIVIAAALVHKMEIR